MTKKIGFMKKNSKQIMAGVIAFIMISSVFAVFLDGLRDDDSSFEYNEFKFKFKNNGYVTKIQKKEFYFYNTPQTMLSFNHSNVFNALSLAQGYIIVFDSDIVDQTSLQSIDLVRLDLADYLFSQNKFVVYGITKQTELYSGLDVFSCENASMYAPIIMLKDSVESNVYVSPENPYCINVDSKNYIHRIKFRDALLYNNLGIIKYD